MEQYVFADQVKKHFRYLIDDYGFSVVKERYDAESFGNSSVQFRSSTTEVVIVLDRGQVLIDIGPSQALPDDQFSLTTIIEFLTPEANEPAYVFPEKWDNYYDMIDWQVIRLARILRQYCDPILRGKFSEWKKLGDFEWKKADKEYKAVTGKGLPVIPKKGAS